VTTIPTPWVPQTISRDLCKLGDFDAARELIEDVLGRRRRIFGAEHPTTVTTAQNLAETLRACNKLDGASRLEAEYGILPE
jgi:hypothetical protein